MEQANSPTSDLAGKAILITGASSGIGAATALALGRAGARVALAARREALLEDLAEAIRAAGGEALVIPTDVSKEQEVAAAVAATVQAFGRLDGAFNNAGITGAAAAVPDLSLENWHDVLDSNLTSGFLGAKYQLPAMVARGGGSLIFTATFVGYSVGFPGMAAYAAAKAGLIGMTQVIATEFGAQNIRANALLPGGTDTCRLDEG